MGHLLFCIFFFIIIFMKCVWVCGRHNNERYRAEILPVKPPTHKFPPKKSIIIIIVIVSKNKNNKRKWIYISFCKTKIFNS